MHVSLLPAHVASFLRRLRAAVHEGRVEIRGYALEGLRDLEWTAHDLQLQLLELSPRDFLRVEASSAPEGGTIWVFWPELWDGDRLWIRLTERAGIVVISFHRG